jgi:hypothetical protein
VQEIISSSIVVGLSAPFAVMTERRPKGISIATTKTTKPTILTIANVTALVKMGFQFCA